MIKTSKIINGSPTVNSKTIIIIKLSKRNSKKNQKKLKEKKTEITKSNSQIFVTVPRLITFN